MEYNMHDSGINIYVLILYPASERGLTPIVGKCSMLYPRLCFFGVDHVYVHRQ